MVSAKLELAILNWKRVEKRVAAILEDFLEWLKVRSFSLTRSQIQHIWNFSTLIPIIQITKHKKKVVGYQRCSKTKYGKGEDCFGNDFGRTENTKGRESNGGMEWNRRTRTQEPLIYTIWRRSQGEIERERAREKHTTPLILCEKRERRQGQSMVLFPSSWFFETHFEALEAEQVLNIAPWAASS